MMEISELKELAKEIKLEIEDIKEKAHKLDLTKYLREICYVLGKPAYAHSNQYHYSEYGLSISKSNNNHYEVTTGYDGEILFQGDSEYVHYFKDGNWIDRVKRLHKKARKVREWKEKADLARVIKSLNEKWHIPIPKKKPLWEYNERCPNCGNEIKNHNIKANETGLSYCSEECADIHVNRNAPEGGY